MNTRSEKHQSEAFPKEEEAERRIAQLEQTLRETREVLESNSQILEKADEALRAGQKELTAVCRQLQKKEEALMRAQDDMANLLASTQIAAVYLDSNLNIRRTTPAADRLLNIPSSDRIQPLDRIASPFEDVNLVDEAKRVLTEQAPSDCQIRTRSDKWYSLCVLPYRTGKGTIEGAVLTMTDIDPLKRTRNELEDREQRLRLALKGGHMGTWDFDPATGRIQWDQRMARLYGMDEDQMPQTVAEFYSLLHPEDRPAVRRRVERALTETGTYEAEFRIHHSDGSRRWLAVCGQVIYDDAGRPSRMLGVNYDITERQTAEEKLQRVNEELENKVRKRTEALQKSREEIRHLAHLASTAEERERRRIAEGLHDDVQQLLAACMFSLQSVGLKVDKAEIQRRITKIAEWCGKALDATRSLIFDLSPAVLYEIGLEAAVKHLADQLKERFDFNVDLITEETIDPLPEELRVFLYSAVRELILNVLHHANVNEARVWLSRKENRIRVQVTDHGRGFKPAELAEMRRAGNGPERLGLITLEERLIPYGGRLDLAAAPGEGTNIRIAVPIQNGYIHPTDLEIAE